MEPSLDQRNADFWDELCGSGLARAVGATGRTPADLARFDAAYLDFYPYLDGYLPAGDLQGTPVLEIGLGYGTLGQVLAGRGARYVGADISPGPVAMMQYRLSNTDARRGSGVAQASALQLPFVTGSFELVFSIGCLHHTGDLQTAVAEVRRVLRPGGRAIVMLYNRRSARQLTMAARGLVGRARRPRARRTDGDQEALRGLYDADSSGRAAPHTDFVTASEVRELFAGFSSVAVDRRNLSAGRLPVPRRWLLASRLDRVAGLDLYIRATA